MVTLMQRRREMLQTAEELFKEITTDDLGYRQRNKDTSPYHTSGSTRWLYIPFDILVGPGQYRVVCSGTVNQKFIVYFLTQETLDAVANGTSVSGLYTFTDWIDAQTTGEYAFTLPSAEHSGTVGLRVVISRENQSASVQRTDAPNIKIYKK